MDRRVTGIKRDKSGNIVALCNSGESWSPRRTRDVIRDISDNKRSYYVKAAGSRAYIRVVSGTSLQTKADATSENSLERLPAG